MKKFFLLSIAAALISFAASAQNYMVVNTETIFRSLPAFNQANETLDRLGQQFQQQVDDAFAEVEEMFNQYVAQRQFLTEAARNARENAILEREAEILEWQESVFGPEGEMMRRRVEMMTPIMERVFGVVSAYAERNGYVLVIDLANNPTVIYYAPSADKTAEIIKLLE
ncbi:MAG: OmpH family outer membrane protein [Rikenellaceae bacterium]|nr:OmpH family outer membrane protein [Rikenellaceae bacterium]MCL2692217.1 OmpH family outer membrane protein [Rikenellaceae bacterium]